MAKRLFMVRKYVIVTILFLFSCIEMFPQFGITVGLLKHSVGSFDEGYVLFAPMSDTNTYLIDKCGYVVHKWGSKYKPGLAAYLLPTGKLLKTGVDELSPFKSSGGCGGIIEIIGWDGKVEWQYKLSSLTECQHHDVEYLPNGNILAIAWDKKSLEEVTTAGRNPALFKKEFWSEQIIELKPIGFDSAEIVWRWKLWDHLVQDYDSARENYAKVELHPELIDANYGVESQKVDWHHINSIDYNPELDQILVSSKHFNEIWVIDHSTTTTEAASHKGGKSGMGGDILYRWGNPQSYRYGTLDDKQLFYQHDASWIPKGFPQEGNIMIFNNLRGPNSDLYSSVDIIKPPVTKIGNYISPLPFAPTAKEWSYTAPTQSDFRAINLSSAQMLKNGNVLVCNGTEGLFFELDSSKNIVWKYINPVTSGGIVPQGLEPQITNMVFRCIFYQEGYDGLEGKDLSRIGIIENRNSNSDDCTLFNSVNDYTEFIESNLYPNPADNIIYIESENEVANIKIYDLQGRLVINSVNMNQINASQLANGIYTIHIGYRNGNYSYKQFIVYR